jgi:hypothetical protein
MDRNQTPTGTIDRMWEYGNPDWSGTDLTGFGVEATDGSIGSIDEASSEVGGSFLVVDTGPWIFGSKVLLPAGVVTQVDTDDRKVHVSQTKDQIKSAPHFDPDTYRDETYRGEVGSYYGRGHDATNAGTINRPSGPDYGEEPGNSHEPRHTRNDSRS